MRNYGARRPIEGFEELVRRTLEMHGGVLTEEEKVSLADHAPYAPGVAREIIDHIADHHADPTPEGLTGSGEMKGLF